MNTPKEIAKICELERHIKGALYYARQYRDVFSNLKPAVRKRAVRDHVQDARKANWEKICLKIIGRKRPVSVVMAALLPSMEQATKRAAAYAESTVGEMAEKLRAHGDIVEAVAPNPSRRATWDKLEQARREVAKQFHQRYMRLTRDVQDPTRYDPKLPRSIDPTAVSEFIADTVENARMQYLEFVFKMDAKVGPGAVHAHLEGSHVWSFSHLFVTMEDGREVVWRTQQIENVSKLGKYFPQWPSRIVKGATRVNPPKL